MHIQNFPTTERFRQIYFLQLLRGGECCNVEVDIQGISENFPGFFPNHDFTGIDVNDLFRFVRLNDEYAPDIIYGLGTAYEKFPEALYGLCQEDFNPQLAGVHDFPQLFDQVKSSDVNNLVAMYRMGSMYMFNNEGTYLNLQVPHSIGGDIFVDFFDTRYVFVDVCDYNEQSIIIILDYHNGTIVECNIQTLELFRHLFAREPRLGMYNVSADLTNNRESVLSMLEIAGRNPAFSTELIVFISESLKDDDEIAFNVVSLYWGNYTEISERLKQSLPIALEAIRQSSEAFEIIHPGLKSNRDFIIQAIGVNAELIDVLPDQYKKDHEIVALAAKAYPLAYAHLPESAPHDLFTDKNKILGLISSNPNRYHLLSEELKKDPEVIYSMIKQNPSIAQQVPVFQSNRTLAFLIAVRFPFVIPYLTAFVHDLSFAMECVTQNGHTLKGFPENITNNREVVMQAYMQNNFAITYAGNELRNDPEIAALIEIEYNKEQDLPF